MRSTKCRLSRLLIVAVAFLSLTGLGAMMTAEPTSKPANAKTTPRTHHIGVVDDWSTHHLIFSNLGSYEQAVAKGAYSKWLNLRYNTRYIMQQAKRRGEAVSPARTSLPPSPANKASLNGGDSVWGSPVTEFCNNGPSACLVNAGDTQTTSGNDYIFFSVHRGNVGGVCNNASPQGCVLAYNVNSPASIPTPPSTLNLTATASPGCWGTGGFIIDNASSLTGTSQIYFINLDGNTPTARPGTCGTAVTTQTIDATQASQSALE